MPICPKCSRSGGDAGEKCPDHDRYFVDEEALEDADGDELIGRLVGDKYAVVEKLDEGGFGAVYRAVQKPVDRPVALKLLHAEIQRTDRGRKRFMREARSVSKLVHPNVVTLYDFGFDDRDRPYMVMEYVEGRTLEQWLYDDDLTMERILRVGRQLLSALSEAHDIDVVHRDLKPDNIIVRKNSEGEDFAKLLDFGLAKPLNDERSQLTQDGEVFGTPHYMSPEQARAKGGMGPASDVYSVGILLYVAITGELPFTADTPLQVLFKQINEELPAIKPREGVEVPEAVEAVIRRATQKEPEDRYEDAGAMLAALKANSREGDREGSGSRGEVGGEAIGYAATMAAEKVEGPEPESGEGTGEKSRAGDREGAGSRGEVGEEEESDETPRPVVETADIGDDQGEDTASPEASGSGKGKIALLASGVMALVAGVVLVAILADGNADSGEPTVVETQAEPEEAVAEPEEPVEEDLPAAPEQQPEEEAIAESEPGESEGGEASVDDDGTQDEVAEAPDEPDEPPEPVAAQDDEPSPAVEGAQGTAAESEEETDEVESIEAQSDDEPAAEVSEDDDTGEEEVQQEEEVEEKEEVQEDEGPRPFRRLGDDETDGPEKFDRPR